MLLFQLNNLMGVLEGKKTPEGSLEEVSRQGGAGQAVRHSHVVSPAVPAVMVTALSQL